MSHCCLCKPFTHALEQGWSSQITDLVLPLAATIIPIEIEQQQQQQRLLTRLKLQDFGQQWIKWVCVMWNMSGTTNAQRNITRLCTSCQVYGALWRCFAQCFGCTRPATLLLQFSLVDFRWPETWLRSMSAECLNKKLLANMLAVTTL